MINNIVSPGIKPKHIISGASVSLLAAGTVTAMALKRGDVSNKEALNNLVKRTTQGTIATAAVVAATNYKGQQNGMFKALTALSIGALGVYAVEQIDRKINNSDELSLEAVENGDVTDEQQ